MKLINHHIEFKSEKKLNKKKGKGIDKQDLNLASYIKNRKNQKKSTKGEKLKDLLTNKNKNKKQKRNSLLSSKILTNYQTSNCLLNHKKLIKNNVNNNKDLYEDLQIKKSYKKRLSRHGFIDSREINDKLIDKKELNEIPYTQALRIDKRSICEIFLYIIANKIEIINIFFYKNIYVHLSMSISIYLFSFLLDIAMNCFLYTDDVISEKYHNDGSLEMFTSLSLSFCSNIISSIITYILKKFGEYSDLLELMIRDIHLKNYFYMNIIKFRKYLKLRLSLFYIIQYLLLLLITYYVTIFCIVYNKSQVSIMINYIYGILESLAISFGISLIITILRYLSLKNKWIKIYRTSQYLNDKF